MRLRIALAFVLLVQAAALLFAPVVVAESSAQAALPACCRRGGLHHCAGGASIADGWKAQPCAMYPQAQHAVTQRQVAAPAVAASARQDLRVEACIVRVALRDSHGSRLSHADRGPPALLV